MEVIIIDIENNLSSVFSSLSKVTSNIDKYIHNNTTLENSFIDNFIHELQDFLLDNRDIYRLKQMPENTIYEITEDTEDYFVTIVNSDTNNLPYLDGIANNIFYIPKNICDLSVDSSLYKVENEITEEVHYQNYLQLNDGVYKVVDKDGNVLQ